MVYALQSGQVETKLRHDSCRSRLPTHEPKTAWGALGGPPPPTARYRVPDLACNTP